MSAPEGRQRTHPQRTVMVAPAGHRVGLTSVSIGLVTALDRSGVAAAFCKPLAQPGSLEEDRSAALVRLVSRLEPPPSIATAHAEKLLGGGRMDELMEEVVAAVAPLSDAHVMVVEGPGALPRGRLVHEGRHCDGTDARRRGAARRRRRGAHRQRLGHPARRRGGDRRRAVPHR
jgi:hypothetical protein